MQELAQTNQSLKRSKAGFANSNWDNIAAGTGTAAWTAV